MEAPPEFKLKDLIAQSEDTGNVQKFGEPMKRTNKVKKRKIVTSNSSSDFSGPVTNGHVKGHVNGNLNGNVNGHTNGNVNGHVNDINDMSRFD